MAQRITDKDLAYLCERLNKLTGSPMGPYEFYTGADGIQRSVVHVGNFHISHAYGGVCLHRMSNTSGGVSCPLNAGHGPKRELYEQMRAMVAGIELVQRQAEQAAKGE